MAHGHTPRDPVKEAFWRGVFQEWEVSGIGQKAFCDRRGLKLTTFEYWRKEISRRDAETKSGDTSTSPSSSTKASPAPVSPPTPGSTMSAGSPSKGNGQKPVLMPVRVIARATLEVVLANGRVIRVPDGVDPNHLRAVLAVAEETPC